MAVVPPCHPAPEDNAVDLPFHRPKGVAENLSLVGRTEVYILPICQSGR